jgi:S1-C subfamily serine protease
LKIDLLRGTNRISLNDTEGGGSEGLGFAIPAAIANFDYESLRKNGHVQRVAIGAKAQNITPTLAAGLGLARSWGAMISDVAVGGAAEAAGLKVEDIVLAIDDRPVLGLPDFTAALYLHLADQGRQVRLSVGDERLRCNSCFTLPSSSVTKMLSFRITFFCISEFQRAVQVSQ